MVDMAVTGSGSDNWALAVDSGQCATWTVAVTVGQLGSGLHRAGAPRHVHQMSGGPPSEQLRIRGRPRATVPDAQRLCSLVVPGKFIHGESRS